MTQRAKILEVLENHKAKALVVRKTACGGDCHRCGGGCGEAKPLVAFVENPIDARPGDVVELYTEDGQVAKKAFITYMIPVILFLAAYIGSSLAGLSAGMSGAVSGVVFVLTILGIMAYDRYIQKHHSLPVVSEIVFRNGQ